MTNRLLPMGRQPVKAISFTRRLLLAVKPSQFIVSLLTTGPSIISTSLDKVYDAPFCVRLFLPRTLHLGLACACTPSWDTAKCIKALTSDLRQVHQFLPPVTVLLSRSSTKAAMDAIS